MDSNESKHPVDIKRNQDLDIEFKKIRKSLQIISDSCGGSSHYYKLNPDMYDRCQKSKLAFSQAITNLIVLGMNV